MLGERGPTRYYRIAYAVIIGMIMGLFWAYLRPNGLMGSSVSSTRGFERMPVGGSVKKVGNSHSHVKSLFALNPHMNVKEREKNKKNSACLLIVMLSCRL